MKRQSGAGLIEALISILILSIGLMGMIGVAARQSFLIDPEGNLAHQWKMDNPMTHAIEVKQELEAKQKSRQM